jgi:hypothetical protein
VGNQCRGIASGRASQRATSSCSRVFVLPVTASVALRVYPTGVSTVMPRRRAHRWPWPRRERGPGHRAGAEAAQAEQSALIHALTVLGLLSVLPCVLFSKRELSAVVLRAGFV